nr:MAG TPA: hypothetical protein [Caudoviricetes sp.]
MSIKEDSEIVYKWLQFKNPVFMRFISFLVSFNYAQN